MLCYLVVVGLVRGALAGVAVGFDTLGAVRNNKIFPEGTACVAVLTSGPFAWGLEIVTLLHDALSAVLASTPLSSMDMSSSY